MAVKINTADLLEIVNEFPGGKKEDVPTLLLEFGTWETDNGKQTGVSVESFGALVPILGPADARRLSKWLLQAAERMDGEKAVMRKGQKKRRHDEEDE